MADIKSHLEKEKNIEIEGLAQRGDNNMRPFEHEERTLHYIQRKLTAYLRSGIEGTEKG